MIPLAPCSSPTMKPTVSTGVCLVPSASSLWDLGRELMQIRRCSATGYVNSNPGALSLTSIPETSRLTFTILGNSTVAGTQRLLSKCWFLTQVAHVEASSRSVFSKARMLVDLSMRSSASFLLCRMAFGFFQLRKASASLIPRVSSTLQDPCLPISSQASPIQVLPLCLV